MSDGIELDIGMEEMPSSVILEEEEVDAIIADAVSVNQSGVRSIQADLIEQLNLAGKVLNVPVTP